ncbi:uncharacterized protein (DUF736 family) [Bradyrhizobium sp. USDA 3311]
MQQIVSPFAPNRSHLLFSATGLRHVFSRDCGFSTRRTWPRWLDLAEDRLRLDRLSRNAVDATFFPWASPIPRESRKSPQRRPPLRSGPRAGASPIVFGLQIAIEAAVVAGSKHNRRSDMANIGSFKKVGNDFQGEIVTLSLQAKGVRIVAETNRSNDNAPSHRIYVGRAEIGAAWSKRSEEGRDYLSLKLDDPSFNAPIYANLFDDEGGEGYNLLWSRPRKNGE